MLCALHQMLKTHQPLVHRLCASPLTGHQADLSEASWHLICVQAWIGTGGLRLSRPTAAPVAEGDDEEAVAAAAAAAAASLAPTLRMLDDNRSSMHIPNVLYEPAMVYLKK